MDTDLADTEARLAARVTVPRLIAAGMIGGVLAFGFVVVALNAGGEAGPGAGPGELIAVEGAEADVAGDRLDADLDPGDPVLSYVTLGIGALILLAYKPIGSAAGRSAAGGAATDEEALAGAFQTRMIVRLVLLEGAAFGNLVVLLVEDWWPSWLLVGVLLAGMLAEFPTAGSLRRYAESRRQLAEFETDAGG